MRTASRDSSKAAFTLSEVVISLALMSVVLAAGTFTFINQQTTLVQQHQITETRQNLRMAAHSMAYDLRMAGLGLPDEDLAAWFGWQSLLTTAVQVVEGGTSTTDTILMAGVFAEAVSALDADSPPGNATLRLPVSDAGRLNTSDRSLVYIGDKELARVVRITGPHVDISTDTSRTNAGLRYAYASGATVEPVEIIRYEISPPGTSFPVRPFLVRHSVWVTASNDLQRMITAGIEDLRATVASNLVSVTFTGRSQRPRRDYVDPTHGDRFWRDTLTLDISPRN